MNTTIFFLFLAFLRRVENGRLLPLDRDGRDRDAYMAMDRGHRCPAVLTPELVIPQTEVWCQVSLCLHVLYASDKWACDRREAEISTPLYQISVTIGYLCHSHGEWRNPVPTMRCQ